MTTENSVRVPRDFVLFLLGEATKNGMGFGEYFKAAVRHKGPYWWRDELRGHLLAAPAPAGVPILGDHTAVCPLCGLGFACNSATPKPDPAVVKCDHNWIPDPDADGWSYCHRCDCSRSNKSLADAIPKPDPAPPGARDDGQGAVDAVEAALDYLRPHLELDTFDAPAWAIQIASILTGGDGCGTPIPATPQPEQGAGLAELAALRGALAVLRQDDAPTLARAAATGKAEGALASLARQQSPAVDEAMVDRLLTKYIELEPDVAVAVGIAVNCEVSRDFARELLRAALEGDRDG